MPAPWDDQMPRYRKPITAGAALVALSTLLGACEIANDLCLVDRKAVDALPLGTSHEEVSRLLVCPGILQHEERSAALGRIASYRYRVVQGGWVVMYFDGDGLRRISANP